MGAGVYVLIGLAANAAGPSVVLSYLFCGLLAFLTTLMFADFARIIPRSGGGYIYVYDALGGIWGFATGWFLALGSIFACGLYAIGFAEYAGSLTGFEVPAYVVKALAIAIVLGLAWMNLKAVGEGNKLQAILTWGNLGILGILILFSVFHFDTDNITPVFPKGFGGTTAAISIIYISFFGYQLIANNSDEIVDPEKTVPKSMKLSMYISISVYVLIALVAVLAVSWNDLGATNAPLVVLATKSLGGYGWLIISIGGVLASLGALNSTLVSQSRQIYVMGKHRFFPDRIGKVDQKSKMPRTAIMGGAALIIVFLLFFDLEFIAKSANFCLLVSLLPVSIALRKIYLKNPEQRPKQRWRRFIPELAFLANLGLLFTLDIVSLAFGQQLALVGAAVYFFYSRKREQRAKKGVNIALKENKNLPFFTGSRILLPMANPQTQEGLFAVANAMLAKQKGEIVVLSVKNVPGNVDFYEALADSKDALAVIERGIELAKAQHTEIRPIVRASRSIAAGIKEAAEEEDSDLIIMGYADHTGEQMINNMDKVMKYSTVDQVFLKLRGTARSFHPKRILVFVSKHTNIDLLFIVATAMAEHFNSRLTLLYRLSQDFGRKEKLKTDRTVAHHLQNLKSLALYNVELMVTDNPAAELIKRSNDFDLMIFRNRHQKLSKEAIANSIEFQVAEQSKCSIIMVKEVPGYKKVMARL